MKFVYFIRHAKAKKEASSDFLRKLNKRGRENASSLGKFLNELSIMPQAFYTSSAVRALSTANIIAEKINFKGEFKSFDELYDFEGKNLLKFVKNLDDKFETIFIVGHNYAITNICEILSDSAIGSIPTCGIFGIGFDIEKFCDIEEKIGKVLLYDYPKKHLS